MSLNDLIQKSRLGASYNVSRAEQTVLSDDLLKDVIKSELSYTFAHAIEDSDKLDITKEMQENGELLCRAELIVFTPKELDELIILVRQGAGRGLIE